MSKNVMKLQLQHMNNIISVMAEEIVARKLGYVLKEEHRKVINAFVRGNDVFSVNHKGMPGMENPSTVGVCLPFFIRLLFVVIVVTPLTGIMKDQVLDTLFALLDCFIIVALLIISDNQPHPPTQKLLLWS